ncbi:thiopeptide-type bacteriocin biosynthesis protein [Chryseobacterium wangxinyae]|uniref:thiopeptide-type bacteriocin biosynthesis protein n=1 Tax=Chryseobacterium sp. CY350 TaxID=2997336 RepID=UPI00226F7CD0|nr:thiopeptide-type bacteriocin biosynthesis protein [Chryseobacterium sp. CY350]MCY0976332.1 thiopeptide-type bacteriocin biosynthesis protein [Chryseobacterium sp. CY350]WBZ94070.1 thiopeptide-type bacteriocin biosynthesis protein [Chryseobacterium sp. CY350]
MTVIRKFAPGTEWLYLKIYTGVKTADLILEEAIQSVAQYFLGNNEISKWFFIRYHDPKPHLRVRFCLHNTEDYFTVLNKINEELQEFTDSGEISNILIETYNREIERYGQNTVEEAETLFHKNSEFTLLCLPYDDEDKLIFGIFLIDQILNKLNLEITEKLAWIRNFNDAFKEEFNADKNLNSQLDKKYREFKPKLINFIQSDEFSDERIAIVLHTEECDAALQNILQHHQNDVLGISLQTFFSSIFHMNINRLFVSDQRLFEMVIYDYLLRYYKSLAFATIKKNESFLITQ